MRFPTKEKPEDIDEPEATRMLCYAIDLGVELRGCLNLHDDHLGSVSLATDDEGNLLSQARYTPYGQVRWDGRTVNASTHIAFRSVPE